MGLDGAGKGLELGLPQGGEGSLTGWQPTGPYLGHSGKKSQPSKIWLQTMKPHILNLDPLSYSS